MKKLVVEANITMIIYQILIGAKILNIFRKDGQNPGTQNERFSFSNKFVPYYNVIKLFIKLEDCV